MHSLRERVVVTKGYLMDFMIVDGFHDGGVEAIPYVVFMEALGPDSGSPGFSFLAEI